MKIYIAGKVSNDSTFGTHNWRDGFCSRLSRLSGLRLDSIDPLKIESDNMNINDIFAKDCYPISICDAVVVYLSDDISVGGSQEILIAKYFSKPVIGLAPYGGKFNGSFRKIAGRMVENYRDPFVFTTCDRVCGDINEVAASLVDLNDNKINIRNIDIVSSEAKRFSKEWA